MCQGYGSTRIGCEIGKPDRVIVGTAENVQLDGLNHPEFGRDSLLGSGD
jgi:hypothetical protein